ncbi:unnamed protein product [Phytophthora fragariaefolia]|uniref:Unnamed protein product n=1 Tax=Phytophthora fragariaefolia TaxID=1490495 RepID=A0A9W6XWC1_9STRA|nr:unnamed protein product [Phytophthora fragariaefolia]
MSHYVFESDDEDDLEGGSPFELISEHSTKEEAVIALHSADMAEYHFLNNYTNTGASCVKTTLYRCLSHQECPRQIRIVQRAKVGVDGGPAVVMFRCIVLLKGGAGPKCCRLMLLQKYSTNPGMLLKIPNVVKLKNSKAALKKSRVAKWNIKDFSVMMKWAHTKMCTSPTAFFCPDGFNPATDQATFAVADLTYQNELLILKSFDHEFVGESGPAVSFVLILHRGDYFGIFEYASSFFVITLFLKFGSQDHASYIATAFTAVRPSIKILNCYPHLARNASKKIQLLNQTSFYDDHIAINIKQLESARSRAQFDAMATQITKYWTSKSEKEYADWFVSQYLEESWRLWYCTAAVPVPGVMPSQNPLESHHKTLKAVCTPYLRAATSAVLNDTLPAVLLLDCDRPPPSTAATMQKIDRIRSRYEYDCKGFWSSGWLCSHVIATLALRDEYDIKTATAHLPTRKAPGGQRKPRSCLSKEGASYFAKDKLMVDLVTLPAMPMNWKVMKQLPVQGLDGNVTNRYEPGQIIDWLDCDGPTGLFRWTVRFQNGHEAQFELDEIAELLESSANLGLNITGKIF